MHMPQCDELETYCDHCSFASKTNPSSLGWHMGMVQVGEVQPRPVPMKPILIWVRVQTHTTHLWVSSNTMGTCKPVQYFIIILFFHEFVLSFSFLSLFFWCCIYCIYCVQCIVQYCIYIV